MGSGAAKCKYETCANSTTSIYCWQHWYKNFADTEDSARSGRLERLARQSKISVDNASKVIDLVDVIDTTTPTQIWSDTKKVFVDIQDKINPEGIRSQVRGYAESAATTASLRFARDERLEVDAIARDKHIENFTNEIVNGLIPANEVVSQEDAEFISNAIASDGLGGFADHDDARAIIAFGIRKEWELANSERIKESVDGIPYDIPYGKFLSVVFNNDIAPHIVIASRREASDFHNNVVIATGSKAANPAAVNPQNSLPARAEAEPLNSSYFNEAREWLAKNQSDQAALTKAQEDAENETANRIRERQETISSMFTGAANIGKGTVRAFSKTNDVMNKIFGTRPEDIAAENEARNKRNRDIYFEMSTRRERNKRGMR